MPDRRGDELQGVRTTITSNSAAGRYFVLQERSRFRPCPQLLPSQSLDATLPPGKNSYLRIDSLSNSNPGTSFRVGLTNSEVGAVVSLSFCWRGSLCGKSSEASPTTAKAQKRSSVQWPGVIGSESEIPMHNQEYAVSLLRRVVFRRASALSPIRHRQSSRVHDAPIDDRRTV
jgi:hypothetical protein